MCRRYWMIAFFVKVLTARGYKNDDIISDAMIAKIEQEEEINNVLEKIINSGRYNYWYKIFRELKNNFYFDKKTILIAMQEKFLNQVINAGLIGKDNPYIDYDYVKKIICGDSQQKRKFFICGQKKDELQLCAVAHCMLNQKKMNYGEMTYFIYLIDQINNNF